jgi:hypothetical protein
LWEFFDTFHVLQRPTYQAKYPPAQAMFLALGQLLGHPVVGVWISFGLFAAALTWMLQAWLPPRWALVGALLMTVRLLAMHGNQQWAYGYWGGSVAALGGALLYGAGRRLWNRPTLSHAIIYSLGLALLANGRPLEGLVASLPISLALAWRYFVQRPFAISAIALRVALPSLVVLSLTFAWMGYYNHRVTGDWKKMPYQLHLKQYTTAPVFSWMPEPKEPRTYVDSVMKFAYEEAEPMEWRQMQEVDGWRKIITYRLRTAHYYCLGLLLIPFFWIGTFSGLRKYAIPVIALFASLTLALQTSWFQPHYLSPVACVIALMVAGGARKVWHVHRIGAQYVTLTLMAYVVLIGCTLVAYGSGFTRGWQFERTRIMSDLRRAGGQHIVIVEYGRNHNHQNDWVYNASSLDESDVLWVRDLGVSRDKDLSAAYPSRRIWRLNVTDPSLKLAPSPMND